MFDKLLGSLLGDEEGTRVELVQVSSPNSTPTIEVRLLRDCGDLGWQVHRRIRMAAGQVSQLRDALNMMDVDAREATPKPTHLRLMPLEDAS